MKSLRLIALLLIMAQSSAFAQPSIAFDSSFKRLILSECDKAISQLDKVNIEEKPALIEFLNRVLLMKGGYEEEGFNPFEPRNKLAGEDFLKTVTPTRDLDTKLCVVRLAWELKERSLPLLPALLKLEANPIFPLEKRKELLGLIREIGISGRGDRKQAAVEVSNEITSKNHFTVSSLLVDLYPESQLAIESLFSSSAEPSQIAAELALKLIDPSGQLSGKLSLALLSRLEPNRKVKIISHLRGLSDVSVEALLFSFKFSSESQKYSIAEEFSSRAGTNTIEQFLNDETGKAQLTKFLHVAPFDSIERISEIFCATGKCDPLFASILRDAPTDGAKRSLLISLGHSQSYLPELWELASKLAPNDNAALVALGAFPAKRAEALALASTRLNELAKPIKKGVPHEERSQSLKALARLFVRISPISTLSLKRSVAEELFNLAPADSEINLPAEAVAAFRPLNIDFLLFALTNRSEAVRKQGLRMALLTKPRDTRVIAHLLGEVGGKTQGDEISAFSVLRELADRNLTEFEKALKDPKLAGLAAEILLALRPGHIGAVTVIKQLYPKANCERRIRWWELIEHTDKKIRGHFWECVPELLNHRQSWQSFLSLASPQTPEEWGIVFKALPIDQTSRATQLGEICSYGPPANLLKEAIAKLNLKESADADTLLKCIQKNPLPEFLPLLGALVEEEHPSLQLKARALQVRMGERNKENLQHLIEALSESSDLDSVAEFLDPESAQLLTQQISLKNEWSNSYRQLFCLAREKEAASAGRLFATFQKLTEDKLISVVESLACIAPDSTEAYAALRALSLFPQINRIKRSTELNALLNSSAKKTPSKFERALFEKGAL